MNFLWLLEAERNLFRDIEMKKITQILKKHTLGKLPGIVSVCTSTFQSDLQRSYSISYDQEATMLLVPVHARNVNYSCPTYSLYNLF